ncbi:MAG: DUF927 domain-containing protein [Methyloglobulus sp.]|nr:DUF927 domain-containing protein [Methyloglobulus sp.]
MNKFIPQYSVKKDTYQICLSEDADFIELANFRVVIKEEICFRKTSGEIEIFVNFDVYQLGKKIKSLNIPNVEFEQFKWVGSKLGLKGEINTIGITSKVNDHLIRAIKKYNPNVPVINIFSRVGYIKESGSNRKFLFNNGSVSSNGIKYESKTKLHTKLGFYQIPLDLDVNSYLELSVKKVFNLLNLSKKNRFIGLVPCLAAFRASTTLFKSMEMDTWFFLVGKTQTYKTTVAQLCTSFYGTLESANNMVSWDSTDYALIELALQARNGILVVDDFVYNVNSGKAKEFTDKAETILRACANGSSRSRKDSKGDSIEDKGRINTMTIATGEFAPNGVNESLLARGIFVPFVRGDIDQNTLTRFQGYAENGDFVKVNIAFIQYLLINRIELNDKIKDWKKTYREKLMVRLQQSSPRTVNQAVGMLIAWKLFLMFAKLEGVIDKQEAIKYQKIVKSRLVSLLKKQRAIYTRSIGSILFESLRDALKEGRMHLIDHKVGGEPQVKDSSTLGWKHGQPQGTKIGWYNVKTGTIFIDKDLPIEDLVALIPDNYKKDFNKPFWKKLDRAKLIVHPYDRLVSRAKLFGTDKQHYQLRQPEK